MILDMRHKISFRIKINTNIHIIYMRRVYLCWLDQFTVIFVEQVPVDR